MPAPAKRPNPSEASQPQRKSFVPVKFSLVKNPIPVDRFHSKLSKVSRSHYQDMLRALASAPRGSVAMLESPKPYGQVRKAAAKLGYECHYAEDGGKLYVQILSVGADN